MNFMRAALRAAIALNVVLASSAHAEVGVTADQIQIGNPNAQTGDNQYAGQQTTIGLKACFNQVNADGGVNGRKITLITCDDKYSPETAGVCFETLTKTGVFALTGLVGSAPSAKYIPKCMLQKIPAVGFHSGPQIVGSPVKRYIFAVRPGYRMEEHQIVEHLWGDSGIRKFGILYQQDAYGLDHLEGLREALKAHNSEPTVAAPYRRNSTNLQEAFNAIKDADPEVVCLAANHHQCEQFIKMARAVNWHPIFFINSGASVDSFIQNVGKEADRVVISEICPSPTRTTIPSINKYNAALKKSFPNEKPCYSSLRGYIDGLVLVEGLKLAGKDLTREKFVDALNGMSSLDLGLGKGMEIKFSPTDHWGLQGYNFSTLNNGVLTAVKDWKTVAMKSSAE